VRTWLFALLLVAAVSAAVAADTGKPAANAADAWHERGRKIYNFRCYFCHGYSGNARTLASTYLKPKPRDFTALMPGSIDRETMRAVVRQGKPGTAMQSFRTVLSDEDVAAVTDFVRREFIVERSPNTRYHTPENGWTDHARYQAAFPFVTGEIGLDAPSEQMTPEQNAGRQLFRETCISCHDQPLAAERAAVWEARPLSYPRNNYANGDNASKPAFDAMASASPYLKHEKAPRLQHLDAAELRGQSLFQDNCAFCHGADGSGRNWIGSYLEPHARDLTRPGFLKGLTQAGLRGVIAEGLPGTSMPAWRTVLETADIDAIAAYVFRAFAETGSDRRAVR
jgi:cytochrome c oxidase cbb3-type subunit 3